MLIARETFPEIAADSFGCPSHESTFRNAYTNVAADRKALREILRTIKRLANGLFSQAAPANVR